MNRIDEEVSMDEEKFNIGYAAASPNGGYNGGQYSESDDSDLER